jgi:hypothetical protein
MQEVYTSRYPDVIQLKRSAVFLADQLDGSFHTLEELRASARCPSRPAGLFLLARRALSAGQIPRSARNLA